MISPVGRMVSLLRALVVAVFAAACSDTNASRDAAADRNLPDAVDASSDLRSRLS